MRTKTQLVKTASTLKEFSSKVKSAQIGETLTPESVQEIAEEIAEVAAVASELAEEIAEGVPAEKADPLGREESEPEQIEVAMDKTKEEKEKEKHAMDKKHAMDDEDEDMKEKLASLTKELVGLKREATLAKLAPKYASLFPTQLHEAKMNEITNSKEPLNIVEARIQEASSIIKNKTMVKIASQTDSIYDSDDNGDEINISAYV